MTATVSRLTPAAAGAAARGTGRTTAAISAPPAAVAGEAADAPVARSERSDTRIVELMARAKPLPIGQPWLRSHQGSKFRRSLVKERLGRVDGFKEVLTI